MNTKKYSLVLRTCNADMSSKNNFIWPTSGPVECTDWNPIAECGNGLHGWLHGHGNGHVSEYWEAGCKWLVVKVKNKHIIDLNGKVKFKKCKVVFCGDRKEATDYIIANDPMASTEPVIGAMIITGDHSTSTSGYNGTSTSGNYSKSTSSYCGKSTTGDYGTSTSSNQGKSITGDHGTSTSGNHGTAISGHNGTSLSGDCGTSLSGYDGTSTSGNHSSAISGDHGTSISGDHGTAISGYGGTSISGYKGTIIIKYYTNDRYYSKVGYIGEGGLEPNVAYKLDADYNFVKA